MNTLVVLLLLFPAAGAILSGLLRKKASDLAALVAVGLMLIVAAAIIGGVFPGTERSVTIRVPWLVKFRAEGEERPMAVEAGPAGTVPRLGHEPVPLFGYLLDPLGMLMLTVVSVLGFLVIVYALDYIGKGNKEHPSREGKERHHFWMLLFVTSMIGVAISPNLLQLYIFWELTTLTSYALISHYRNDESLRAGFKALLMTYSGGVFFAIAIVTIFVKTGTFDFAALDQLSPGLRSLLFVAFLIAAWAKSAQVPFYTWLPDAMAAPTTVSMYLHAAAMVKAGVFLIARISTATQQLSMGSGLLLGIMAVVTMLVGVYLFFFQDDLKRLLAFSTITHLSYILLGLSFGIMGSRAGMLGGIMHIMNHGVGKGLLFLCVGAISYVAGTRSIRELSGLAKRAPLIGVAFLVGMFAILGVPPFSGFWSKFFLIMGAVDVGGAAGYLLLVPFVLEIIIAFAWFLRVGQKVFFGTPSPAAEGAKNPPAAMSFSLVVLMVLCVIAPFVALAFAHQIGF